MQNKQKKIKHIQDEIVVQHHDHSSTIRKTLPYVCKGKMVDVFAVEADGRSSRVLQRLPQWMFVVI